MASRILAGGRRLASRANPAMPTARSFHSSSPLQTSAAPLPPRKPVGAFRGGLLGFFLGSTVAGAGVYTYLIKEYKISNELLTEDIYALQAAVQRVTNYVQVLEDKMDSFERKKK
ncbi:hypothetical protein ACRALDRAFT_1069542 [Sodiomyces alcalophilus JCM 7366]|uniref:uncharacterized protein n=1 Tax=Sodiomyces alcalophilus JCM 7366 TaxID=591952 RepID=UPI0039B4F5BE